MNFDLSAFSPDQLEAMISQAKERKKVLAKRRPVAIVRAQLIATAAEYGYTIEEVLGEVAIADKAPKKRRSPLKGTKAAVKYRDPDYKRNTWSGRGSMPRWLAEKVKRGKSATDYLLPGLAKPTANAKNVGKRTVVKKA